MAEIWKVIKDVLADGCQTWDAYLLGQDEYGIWLYTPTRTQVRDGHGQQIDTLQAHAQLFPLDKPWVASWFQDGSVAATVTTPAETDNRSIRYVDLGMHHWVSGNEGVIQDETQAYDQALETGRASSVRADALRATFTDLKR